MARQAVRDDVVSWSELGQLSPEGIAVIDRHGLFVQLNASAVALSGRELDDLLGMPSPFEHVDAEPRNTPHLLEDDDSEHLCSWAVEAGVRRQFAYRSRHLPRTDGLTMVSFRDVTNERQRRRRIAAIARTSAKLATEGSLPEMLDALASEVLRADVLAAVEIITLDTEDGSLRIMGTAGFSRWPDFFDRLMECRDRGATLHMMGVLDRHESVVIADRWREIASDPAWAPLHEYHLELEWGTFASIPLMIRGRAAGALNAFFASGENVGHQTMEFLTAMAEQAAIAVDYASMMHSEREAARRVERQRLARDLHDSIVQQAFSISMQAKSMGVLAERDDFVPAEAVKRSAEEIGGLSRTVLTDLRAMVHQLRPASTTQLGVDDAVRTLAASTAHRTGLTFDLQFTESLAGVEPELAEDLYRIVAEAIHNVVKHARARTVRVHSEATDDKRGMVLTVADDGVGIAAAGKDGGSRGRGYGLMGMRERAERWGGTLTFDPRPDGGSVVTATVPLPTVIAVGPRAE
ncbi:MAG: ATP-binding protein [Rhodococcus sp. (in: high G+C Gram-positive bacteria)]